MQRSTRLAEVQMIGKLQPHNEVVSIPLIAPDYQMLSKKVSLPYQVLIYSSKV
jgi:hypothetical protein